MYVALMNGVHFRKEGIMDISLKEDKGEIIMDAALKVFKAKGAEKTSGTFYLYYTDKKDLEEKMVVNIAMDVIIKAEAMCLDNNPIERYISFLDYIIDYLIANPFELDLVSKNITWALYTKIENDSRLKEADSGLKFILSKYENLFTNSYTESQKLYILSLTLEIVMSTCKSAIMVESILSIDEMKAVLYASIRKMFNRTGENK